MRLLDCVFLLLELLLVKECFHVYLDNNIMGTFKPSFLEILAGTFAECFFGSTSAAASANPRRNGSPQTMLTV